jgi:hypothetical protein
VEKSWLGLTPLPQYFEPEGDSPVFMLVFSLLSPLRNKRTQAATGHKIGHSPPRLVARRGTLTDVKAGGGEARGGPILEAPDVRPALCPSATTTIVVAGDACFYAASPILQSRSAIHLLDCDTPRDVDLDPDSSREPLNNRLR